MNNAIDNYLARCGFESFHPLVVLFDMDGVLYDSMWNHAASWRESMERYGIHMTDMDAFRYEGMRGVETIQLLAREQLQRAITEEEAAEMYRHKSEVYASKGVASLIPGVRELQETLHRHGLKIGVVTGSGQPTLIDRILDDFKGWVSPGIIVTAHDVTRGKPQPEPYIAGMQKAAVVLQQEGGLQVGDVLKPWQTMVVENAPLGVRAAAAAQCFTVAVNTGPLPDEQLSEAGADIVFHSMDELRQAVEKCIMHNS